jgi:hypothetical protein
MTPSFETSPAAYFAYQRARAKAIQARAKKKLGQLGGETATRSPRRPIHLTPEQRSAALKAKSGPLGWIFTGSSLEDVVRDSTTLKKIMRIYRARPRMRHASARTTITLPSGKTVRFHADTGEVTPQ